MNTKSTIPKNALRLAGISLATGLLSCCSLSLTRLPDGSVSLKGNIAQPVIVKGGEK